MCSGERFGKSNERFALFFTQGALDKLSREELSGVVGHEFSHAFHQDVALNLRIFSLIFGFMSISFIGEIILESIDNRTRSSWKNNTKSSAIFAIFALSFYALGALGALCANLIQAAISRQKEFLADATSVQYTHNPNAILRALQTIAQEGSPKELQGFLHNKLAKPYAHMFFLQGFKGTLATHPPINKRIKALESIAHRALQ